MLSAVLLTCGYCLRESSSVFNEQCLLQERTGNFKSGGPGGSFGGNVRASRFLSSGTMGKDLFFTLVFIRYLMSCQPSFLSSFEFSKLVPKAPDIKYYQNQLQSKPVGIFFWEGQVRWFCEAPKASWALSFSEHGRSLTLLVLPSTHKIEY